MSWLNTCPAIDAATGKRCCLPAHAGIQHANGTRKFVQVAAPGQTFFPERELLDIYAQRRGSGDADGLSSSKSLAQERREYRARAEARGEGTQVRSAAEEKARVRKSRRRAERKAMEVTHA